MNHGVIKMQSHSSANACRPTVSTLRAVLRIGMPAMFSSSISRKHRLILCAIKAAGSWSICRTSLLSGSGVFNDEEVVFLAVAIGACPVLG